MSGLRFSHPEALLLFLVLPVVVALARARTAPGGALVLRTLVFTFLVLSLAAPQLSRSSAGLSVVFAVDVSESISPPARADAVEFVRAASAARRPVDRIGTLTFA